MLFDAFFMTHAGRAHYDVFTKACAGRREVDPLGQQDEDTLFEHYSLKWYGWMLSAMASRTRAGKAQLFIISRLVKFLGLSRAGQDILAKFGFASTLRYSDRMGEETLQKARLENMYTLTQSHYSLNATHTYTCIDRLIRSRLCWCGQRC
jgi:hypothetical protein